MSQQIKPSYILTQSGTLSITWNGRHYTVNKEHLNYNKIISCVKEQKFGKLDLLLDMNKIIARQTDNKCHLRDGVITFNGETVHNVIADRILKLHSEGWDTKPVILLLQNFLLNPIPECVEAGYQFIDEYELPITADGCFIGYKNVDKQLMDHHSGTIKYALGVPVGIPRESTDSNRHTQCSYGLHVGSYEYAKTFNNEGQVLVVKVNPKDIVSVPYDTSQGKIRVCEVLPLYIYGKNPEKLKPAIKAPIVRKSGKLYGVRPDGSKFWNKRGNGGRFITKED